MKQFLFHLSIFIVFLFILLFILCRPYYTADEASGFMGAIIDKHKLIEKTPSPRIILCGGSNLAFGVDSKRIKDSIGLPVINMGLHASLGLEFIINEIIFSAKSSDIVILSIEYSSGDMIGLDLKGDYRLKIYSASIYPKANKFFKTNYLDEFNIFISKLGINFKNNIKYLRHITPTKNIVYSRSSFNIYGDVVKHLEEPSPKILNDRIKFKYRKWAGINFLNEFAGYAKSKNIKVYFIFPDFPESEYIKNKEVILKYAKDLESELNITIINKPDDFVFADSLFYDTVYHLNKKGREKRTVLLIEILKRITGSDNKTISPYHPGNEDISINEQSKYDEFK